MIKLDLDKWLSEIFGYSVFKVGIGEPVERAGVPALLKDLLPASINGGPAFLYARVPTSNVDQVRGLAGQGFYVVDVNVTFALQAKPGMPTSRNSVTVRDVLPGDRGIILGIAESCFQYSRFHLDSRIPGDVADTIKCEWVRSYMDRRRGERLFIALLDNRPVGFLAALDASTRGRSAKVIDLMGVDRAFQGRGVGTSLVEFFINTYAGMCDLLRAGTQVSNFASMRLYERSGFRISESDYILHAHMNGGRFQ